MGLFSTHDSPDGSGGGGYVLLAGDYYSTGEEVFAFFVRSATSDSATFAVFNLGSWISVCAILLNAVYGYKKRRRRRQNSDDSNSIPEYKKKMATSKPPWKVAKQPTTHKSNTNTIITIEEVRNHDSPSDDCWIVVDGKVYDVTQFATLEHPGGPNVIRAVAGFDATEAFHAMHGTGKSLRKAKLMMTKYCVGRVEKQRQADDDDGGDTKKANADSAALFAAGDRYYYPVGREKDTECRKTGFAKDDNSNISNIKTNAVDSNKILNEKEHHNNNTNNILPLLHDVAAGDAAFQKLRKEITSDPSLWRAEWRDTIRHALRAVPFFCVCMAIILRLQRRKDDVPPEDYDLNSWISVVIAAICLGMFWHQSAFVAHDACHRGTPEHTTHGSWHWFGTIYASFLFGISTSMWTDEHYVHHVAVRRPHGDPQFEYYPICLLSLKELDVTHPLNWFVRTLLKIQHVAFLPLAVIVGRINLHVISIIYTVKHCLLYYVQPVRFGGRPRPIMYRPDVDFIGMAFYWYYQLCIISMLPSSSGSDDDGLLSLFGCCSPQKLVFFFVSNWVCGLLHVQLLVSHIGVESFTHQEQMTSQSWFSHQVLTSRNVTTSKWDGWLWGGLEYQIEHHLFPRLPRESLRKISPRVRKLCEQYNLPYRSHKTSDVIRDVVNDFKSVATLALEIPA